MKKITLIALMLFTALGYAQIGINTNNPDASSALEIESTTGGILIPRLTQTQRDAISAPATGLMIYQTNGTSGFYFYNGNIWTKVDGVAGPQGPIGLTGSAGADGVDGAQGPIGLTGAAGIDGAGGVDGVAGPQGPIGLTGSAGADGVDGAQGPIGLTGAAGIDGTNGSDGQDGAQGATGFAGPAGDQGVAGPQGATGPSGANGINGINGIDGQDGTNGNDGQDGNDGADGADGAPGVDGAPGAAGVDGADGASYTQPTYNIGDIVNGGVVFWLDSTGQHGLVVAFSDVATYVEWGCYGIDLPNVPNVLYNGGNPLGLGAEIGDGFNNTNNILKDCPTAPAALAARSSYGPDWFLPSANELNQIYINKTTLEGVSGFTGFSDYYWSSSEYAFHSAWRQFFSSGNQAPSVKDYTAVNVRAVRAF